MMKVTRSILLVILIVAIEQGMKLVVYNSFEIDKPELRQEYNTIHIHPLYNYDLINSWNNNSIATGTSVGLWRLIDIFGILIKNAFVLYLIRCIYRGNIISGANCWKEYVRTCKAILFSICICNLSDIIFWGKPLDYICFSILSYDELGRAVAEHYSYNLNDFNIYILICLLAIYVVKTILSFWKFLNSGKGDFKKEDYISVVKYVFLK